LVELYWHNKSFIAFVKKLGVQQQAILDWKYEALAKAIWETEAVVTKKNLDD
jgi:hypothetical protein